MVRKIENVRVKAGDKPGQDVKNCDVWGDVIECRQEDGGFS